MMIYLADVYGSGEFRPLDKLEDRELSYLLRCCDAGCVRKQQELGMNDVVEQIQIIREGRAMNLLPRPLK